MQKKVARHSLISIVVPSYNEEASVSVLFDKIQEQMGKYNFEVIFVDDGSTDKTLSNLSKMAKDDSRVKFISFSRNFGHQAALRAGLKSAKGGAVISMDADLQHPPELLPNLITKWEEEGYDIVYTRRNDTFSEHASIFKKKSSAGFYRLMNWLSGLNIDPGAADFRLLDREVVDVMNSFSEPDIFLRGLVNWIGFKSVAIDYVPSKRFAGQSKYSLKKMLNFALSGITQFSIKPLRLTVVVGFLVALAAALYALYAVFDYVVGHNAVTGWTSLIIVVLLTSGIQMILLGVVGEYVGRTFMQTKARPDYIIAKTNIEQ
jgi:polyisoprenyl-phosphate glycosyltransferase